MCIRDFEIFFFTARSKPGVDHQEERKTKRETFSLLPVPFQAQVSEHGLERAGRIMPRIHDDPTDRKKSILVLFYNTQPLPGMVLFYTTIVLTTREVLD